MKISCNINPALFFDTEDIRSDVNYWIGKNNNGELKFDNIFEVVSPDIPKFEELPEIFKYCEIGNLDSNEILIPSEIYMANIDDETDENAKLHNKAFKKNNKGKWRTDDIMRVEVGDILVSKVRPLLNKVVLVNDDYKDCYFTKAFIRLRIKNTKVSPELGYYLIRNLLNKELIAISRIGKSGYPAIKTEDLKNIVIDISKDRLENANLNQRMKVLHNQKQTAYKEYIKSVQDVNTSIREALLI